MKKVELEEIKRKQRVRGVIEPLLGRNTARKKLLNNNRGQLAYDLKKARIRGKTEGYTYLGTHYDDFRTQMAFPDFDAFRREAMHKALQSGKKVR